ARGGGRRRKRRKETHPPRSPRESAARANKDYAGEQYRRYQTDPNSVDDWWRAFFAGFELGTGQNGGSEVIAPLAGEPATERNAEPVIGVFDLIHSYRELGHLVAHPNPPPPPPPPPPPLPPPPSPLPHT